MRDLHSARAERQGKIDHFADARNVLPMHDGVDGERQLQTHDLMGEFALAGKGAVIAGDTVGGVRLAVLDRDLDVIKSRVAEFGKPPGGQANAGGDQIGVEPGGAGSGRNIDEVTPRGGLAPGEMGLKNPKPGRLAEDTRPGRQIKLVFTRLQRQWIRAVRTTERTAVGELRQQADRPREAIGAIVRHVTVPGASFRPGHATAR